MELGKDFQPCQGRMEVAIVILSPILIGKCVFVFAFCTNENSTSLGRIKRTCRHGGQDIF